MSDLQVMRIRTASTLGGVSTRLLTALMPCVMNAHFIALKSLLLMVVDLLLYILYDIIRERSRQVKKEQINQRYTYSKMLQVFYNRSNATFSCFTQAIANDTALDSSSYAVSITINIEHSYVLLNLAA